MIRSVGDGDVQYWTQFTQHTETRRLLKLLSHLHVTETPEDCLFPPVLPVSPSPTTGGYWVKQLLVLFDKSSLRQHIYTQTDEQHDAVGLLVSNND